MTDKEILHALSTPEGKVLDKEITHICRLLEKARTDAAEWKQQHENLLEVRRQDLESLNAEIKRLRGDWRIQNDYIVKQLDEIERLRADVERLKADDAPIPPAPGNCFE